MDDRGIDNVRNLEAIKRTLAFTLSERETNEDFE